MNTVKDVYIRTLSRKVPIFIPATKRALTTYVNQLDSTTSELTYRSWAIEHFIVGVTDLYSDIADLKSEPKKQKARDALYRAVIRHNPLLDPDNLFIDGGGLTFTNTGNCITESDHWSSEEDESNIPVISDLHKYFELSRSAREHDHEIETEYSTVLDLGIKIRVFPKKHRDDLVFGLDPKTKQQLEFYIVNICIDSFHDVYSMLQESNEVPLGVALKELYSSAIEHNPFLDLTLRQLKKINQTIRTHRQAMGGSTAETSTRTRKSLKSVPRTEIMNLEKHLKSQIFGQDEAVQAVADAYKRAVSGIKNPKTPVGAFLFYGETSTGKTEIARTVARLLTKGEKGLLKISCNTLQSAHSVSTLIGSPPGYVGSEDNGCLAAGLEESKFKVVLFDEVDKAHKNIYDLVLEMLEEGKIMVANGEVLDFSECLIIFTSNMGQQEGNSAANAAGFSAGITDKGEVKKQVAKKILEKKLTPEFRARLTGEFYFKPLEREDLVKSAKKYLDERAEQLKKNKINFTFHHSLAKKLLTKCEEVNKTIHPRILNNFIEQEIFKNLGDFLINSDLFGSKKVVHINYDSLTDEFQKVEPPKKEKKVTAKVKRSKA